VDGRTKSPRRPVKKVEPAAHDADDDGSSSGSSSDDDNDNDDDDDSDTAPKRYNGRASEANWPMGGSNPPEGSPAQDYTNWRRHLQQRSTASGGDGDGADDAPSADGSYPRPPWLKLFQHTGGLTDEDGKRVHPRVVTGVHTRPYHFPAYGFTDRTSALCFSLCCVLCWCAQPPWLCAVEALQFLWPRMHHALVTAALRLEGSDTATVMHVSRYLLSQYKRLQVRTATQPQAPAAPAPAPPEASPMTSAAGVNDTQVSATAAVESARLDSTAPGDVTAAHAEASSVHSSGIRVHASGGALESTGSAVPSRSQPAGQPPPTLPPAPPQDVRSAAATTATKAPEAGAGQPSGASAATCHLPAADWLPTPIFAAVRIGTAAAATAGGIQLRLEDPRRIEGSGWAAAESSILELAVKEYQRGRLPGTDESDAGNSTNSTPGAGSEGDGTSL
jgi:hypothetical protein